MNDNNFFSVDRLVEFGMGMAMAQQMVNMMNKSMQQMYVPGSIQSMPQPTPQQHANIIYLASTASKWDRSTRARLSLLSTTGASTKTHWLGCRECLPGSPLSKSPRFLRL